MREDNTGIARCGCFLIWMILGLSIGALASNYLIAELFHKNIPFIWDMVIGIAGGEVIVPVAIVYWILKNLKVI